MSQSAQQMSINDMKKISTAEIILFYGANQKPEKPVF